MAANKIICTCKNVDYVTIRMEMVKGARTLDQIKEMTGAATGCGKCAEEIEKILSSVCGCTGTSMESVINAVRNGADTTEKVAEITGAGEACGRCKVLVKDIIERKF